MTSFAIRPYHHTDRDALTHLWAESFPNDPLWNEPNAMLDQKLGHSPESLLVGLNDGVLVAAVMAGYDGHRGWINALAVKPGHRQQAFGAAMVRAAVNFLNDQGAVKVNLQVRGDNHSLQRYYESLGFVTEDRISMAIMTETGKTFTA